MNSKSLLKLMEIEEMIVGLRCTEISNYLSSAS